MIVFLPLLSLQGLEGKLFAPVAMTIIFALGASLVLSLTVVRVIASYALKASHGPAPWLVRCLEAFYRSLLGRALGSDRLMIVASLAALLLTLALFPFLGKSFMPTLDEGDIIMQKMRTSEMLSGARGDLAVKVYGPDNTVLASLGEQILKQLREIDGSQEVLMVRNEGVQYLQIDIDRVTAGRLGFSVKQVQTTCARWWKAGSRAS